jgi:hypothetical protein
MSKKNLCYIPVDFALPLSARYDTTVREVAPVVFALEGELPNYLALVVFALEHEAHNSSDLFVFAL